MDSHRIRPPIPPVMHNHYHYHYNIYIVNETTNAQHGIREQDLAALQQANIPTITQQNMFFYHHFTIPPPQPNVATNQYQVEHVVQYSYIHYYAHFHYYHGIMDIDPSALRTKPSIGFLLATIENRFTHVPQTHSHFHQHIPITDLPVFGDSSSSDGEDSSDNQDD